MKSFVVLLIMGVLLGGALSSKADVTVTILQPTADQLVNTGSSLEVQVKIQSAYEVANVQTSVGSAFQFLTFNADQQIWEGTLDLTGQTRGSLTLNVTAINVNKETGSAHQVFNYQPPPAMTITSPANGTVYDSSFPYQASCSSDVNCTIDLYYNAVFIESHRNNVEGTASLIAEPGVITVTFLATDDLGETSEETRTIYYNPSLLLEKETSVDGYIMDATPDRILYNMVNIQTNIDKLFILDRSSGVSKQIDEFPHFNSSEFGSVVPVGNLIPRGALYHIYHDQFIYNGLEFGRLTTGELVQDDKKEEFFRTDIIFTTQQWGPYNSTPTIRDYALLQYDNNVVYLNLKTGTRIDYSICGDFLSPNGDTLSINRASDPKTLMICREDQIIQSLPLPKSQGLYTSPNTDGVNINYQQISNVLLGDGMSDYYLLQPKGSVFLTHDYGDALRPRSKPRVVLNNGWTAFYRGSEQGQPQIWLRSPQGDMKQMAFSSASSQLDALGPNGEFTFKYNGHLYLGGFGWSHEIDLGSDLGNAYFEDGQWRVILANTLYKVVDPMPGDANLDNVFDSTDLSRLLQTYVGTLPQPAVGTRMQKAMDVEPAGGDGVVDSRDVNTLFRLFLGL